MVSVAEMTKPETKIRMTGHLAESLVEMLESTGSGYGEVSALMTAALIAWKRLTPDERLFNRDLAATAKRRSARRGTSLLEEVNGLLEQRGLPLISPDDDSMSDGVPTPRPSPQPVDPGLAARIAAEHARSQGRSKAQQSQPKPQRHQTG